VRRLPAQTMLAMSLVTTSSKKARSKARDA
jgi:hypothetical protein